MKTTEILQAKRRELKEISNTLRDAKTNGEIQTINEGLKEIYKQQGNADLRTFEQWKKAAESIPETGIGKHIALLYGSVVRTVVNHLTGCILLIESALLLQKGEVDLCNRNFPVGFPW